MAAEFIVADVPAAIEAREVAIRESASGVVSGARSYPNGNHVVTNKTVAQGGP